MRQDSRHASRCSRATLVLAGLLTAGVAIRIVACLAIWPVATTLSDAANYAADAATNPLADPQHPGGYSALLAAIGALTRSVAATVVLQHALGVSAAVLVFAAVRRLTGSPWPALIPAAVILLNTDEIFLEHNVMSEGPFVFVLVGSIYAVVRTIDAPQRERWRWAALAGGLIAAATVVRSAGLFMVPILALAIARTPSSRQPAGKNQWRAAGLFLATATLLLTGYAVANNAVNGAFRLVPTPGWHFYARVAPFADCRTFTAPAGTRYLCERSAPDHRSGPDWYLYDPRSPARQHFGHIGRHDGQLGAFAVQVFLHQPAAVAHAVWVDVRRYYVPSAHEHGWYKGWDIEPQLDWARQGGPNFTRDTITGLEKFFTPFEPARNKPLVGFLHTYEQVFGFGGTLLTVSTLLTILGLCAARERYRAGILLFGIGGLAQLIPPTFGELYMGRYMVPVAGLMAASAAISCSSLAQRQRRRRAMRVGLPQHRGPVGPVAGGALAETRIIRENAAGGL